MGDLKNDLKRRLRQFLCKHHHWTYIYEKTTGAELTLISKASVDYPCKGKYVKAKTFIRQFKECRVGRMCLECREMETQKWVKVKDRG